MRIWRTACVWAAITMAATGAFADERADIDQLIDVLAFDETIEIMHQEGLRYGADVAEGLMPEADLNSWQDTVARIYDTDKMLTLISRDFATELEDVKIAPILAYFTSEAGRDVVRLELEARRAFLDPGVEAAATERFTVLENDKAPLIRQVDQLISDSDLVEFNVMGTLNASLMFYRGLTDGGAYDMSEEEMLRDVWSQEEDTRASSEEWLGAFLTLAYQPLEGDVLDGYAAFYRTKEGQQLNRAIFAAFDNMYLELSYLMGLAVAEHLTSEPL